MRTTHHACALRCLARLRFGAIATMISVASVLLSPRRLSPAGPGGASTQDLDALTLLQHSASPLLPHLFHVLAASAACAFRHPDMEPPLGQQQGQQQQLSHMHLPAHPGLGGGPGPGGRLSVLQRCERATQQAPLQKR